METIETLEKELQAQNDKDGKMKGETFWAWMNELYYEKYPKERPISHSNTDNDK